MNAQSKISETTYSTLPRGFKMRDDGIYREVASKDGETPELVWLCSPMRVLALPRDRSGTGWGRLVEVIDPDGPAHRVTIPARMFAGGGEELRAGLLDLGLDLAPDPAARRALADLLTRWQPPARATTADRLGWADEACAAFILGDGRILGDEHVVFQKEKTPAAAAEMRVWGFCQCAWRNRRGRLRRPLKARHDRAFRGCWAGVRRSTSGTPRRFTGSTKMNNLQIKKAIRENLKAKSPKKA